MNSNPGKTMQMLTAEMSAGINKRANNLLRVLKANTPVKSGNARRSWRMVSEIDISSSRINTVIISNDAAYIGLLDEGSSKQAPNGIVEKSLRQAFK